MSILKFIKVYCVKPEYQFVAGSKVLFRSKRIKDPELLQTSEVLVKTFNRFQVLTFSKTSSFLGNN